jgi:hypothetical protein
VAKITPAQSFEMIDAAMKRLLYLEDDPLFTRIAFASFAANRYPGGKAWLMIVGGPSTGKSEHIDMFEGCSTALPFSECSEKGFVSASNPEESLLSPRINNKVLMVSDMSTITAGRPDEVNKIYGILRWVFDGKYRRQTGSGKMLEWTGKVGFIAAATPAIDKIRSFQGELGERFIHIRPRSFQPELVMDRAYKMEKRYARQKADIASMVSLFIEAYQPSGGVAYKSVVEALKRAAQAMARGRATVPRDRFTKEIDGRPSIESPVRIMKQLQYIAYVLQDIGTNKTIQRHIMLRFIYDALPSNRRAILNTICHSRKKGVLAGEVRDHTEIGNSTVRRAIEDMKILGIIRQDADNTLTMKDEHITKAVRKWGTYNVHHWT